ncbi:hypothetical protein ABZW30_26785 [Kitasatospora sp. NPDC004669]|uniref:hypothetical protein n=1 Tax=Kitasatospora sp. NPDC004669 TaxID=3154555 RepID=UPI0033B48FE5
MNLDVTTATAADVHLTVSGSNLLPSGPDVTATKAAPTATSPGCTFPAHPTP